MIFLLTSSFGYTARLKMDEVQHRVQNAVNSMVNSLDREHFRKLQSTMYRCSASCCENKDLTMDEVQRCIDRCSEPINKAQTFMQTELQGLQDRLQRCAMDCQDQVKDKIGPNTAESDMPKFRKQLESCVVKCADTHIGLIPNMEKKIKAVLKDVK